MLDLILRFCRNNKFGICVKIGIKRFSKNDEHSLAITCLAAIAFCSIRKRWKRWIKICFIGTYLFNIFFKPFPEIRGSFKLGIMSYFLPILKSNQFFFVPLKTIHSPFSNLVYIIWPDLTILFSSCSIFDLNLKQV
jgi:hypothetical protein